MDKSPTVRFGSFKGMDNIHQDYELPHDVLRRAVNTDIMDSGRLRRRRGSSQALALSGAHSLWSDGASAYVVQNNTLRRFYPNGTSASLGAFNAGTNRASYYRIGNTVYVTSKTARARIVDGVMQPWGIEVPVSAPVLMAGVGVMPAGTYLACVTYLTADGRESGASMMGQITLATPGGITTTGMPVPTDPSVTKKRLYLTTADGEVLFMAAECNPTDLFVSCGTPPAGSQLRTQFKVPPPFADGLAYSNGRLYMIDAADPRIVWFTDALDYDHVDLRRNYYLFGSPVTLIAGVNDGLYACADKTYFISNAGTGEHFQRERLEFGAIAGSMQEIPDSDSVIWMSPRGPVIGKIGGEVQLLADKMIAVGGMIEAASMVREKDGLRQFVVVGNNSDASAMQAGSYAEAEIVRRATV